MKGNMTLLTIPGTLGNPLPKFTETLTTDFYFKHQGQPL